MNTPRETTMAPPRTASPKICILGIGNLLWADEGFGVRCLEQLQHSHALSGAEVDLVDGGTQGLYLLPYIQEADALLIFDAVDYGLAPGTLKIVRDGEVPRFLGAKKMSLHQTGFQEVLQLAVLTEQYPRHVTLIGCQPEELDDYGGSLRPVVKQAMVPALQAALQELQAWGVHCTPRAAAPDESASAPASELSMGLYETERPASSAACRVGDERFFS
ncbi:MAG: HyaD/HybD family hydrogenase maturation endopeptidase [Proteobacteria bacterium]|nr:HyaD/HybD family hydrogenase maturation endopeptidase [Pseudomonadota bacterium]